nr:MAG TPA: hypothetical protein [Caudoviricetes sp.]
MGLGLVQTSRPLGAGISKEQTQSSERLYMLKRSASQCLDICNARRYSYLVQFTARQ